MKTLTWLTNQLAPWHQFTPDILYAEDHETTSIFTFLCRAVPQYGNVSPYFYTLSLLSRISRLPFIDRNRWEYEQS